MRRHPNLPSLSFLLPLLTLIAPVLADTSTVAVLPTPLLWQDAMVLCQNVGTRIYPVPATPTDPVYEVLRAQPAENGDRYWISRRHGQSCTCLNRNGVEGDLWMEEAPCGEVLPAFCQL